MTDPSPTWDSTSVAAVLARRSHEDVTELLAELVTMLAGLLPDARVKRSLLRREITSIRVPLGGYVYCLERQGGRFAALRQQAVRGVVIRSDPMEIDAFLAELGTAVDAERERNDRWRAALATWAGF